jgi:hypothetical protein
MMIRARSAGLILLLCAAVSGTPLGAQVAEGYGDSGQVPRGRLFVGEALGGAGGMAGGLMAAGTVAVIVTRPRDTYTVDESLRDVFLVAAWASAGAIVGGAIGSHLGARAAGGQGGRSGQRLLAQGFGFLAGAVIVSRMYRGDREPPPLLSLAIWSGIQGSVGALTGPRR